MVQLGQKTPRYSAALLKEAQELYVSGMGSRAVLDVLEERHGVRPSVGWLRIRLRKLGSLRSRRESGLLRWKNSRKISEREMYRMRYQDRSRLVDIAAAAGCSVLTVREVFRRLAEEEGEEVSYLSQREAQLRRPDVSARRQVAVALRLEGKCYREIRELTGMSFATIHRSLAGAGLSRRMPWSGRAAEQRRAKAA